MLDVPFKKEHGELCAEVPPMEEELKGLQAQVGKLSKGASLKDIQKLSDAVEKFDDKVYSDEKHTDDLIDRLKPIKEMLANKGK